MQGLLTWLGYGLCHQLPERSFFAGGYQLPVCARDTGIYIGFVVSLAIVALLHRGRRPSGFPRPLLLGIAFLMVAAMAADGFTSYASLRDTSNDLRLMTGLLAGYALAVAVVPILNGQFWERASDEPPLNRWPLLAAWLLSILPVFAVVRWVLPFAGIVYPVLLSVAIVATFTVINLVVICLIPRFERAATTLVSAWPQVLVGVVAAFIELAFVGWIRDLLIGLVA
ncbi:MAG: DUF2085 domain-containing protein [Anaerosomatales bacterium]|nr:DUF2085 domain-containing protein [Anaerosomatales bacterium]